MLFYAHPWLVDQRSWDAVCRSHEVLYSNIPFKTNLVGTPEALLHLPAVRCHEWKKVDIFLMLRVQTSVRVLFKGFTHKYENSLEMCICFWQESDHPEVTQHGWQDAKNSVGNLLFLKPGVAQNIALIASPAARMSAFSNLRIIKLFLLLLFFTVLWKHTNVLNLCLTLAWPSWLTGPYLSRIIPLAVLATTTQMCVNPFPAKVFLMFLLLLFADSSLEERSHSPETPILSSVLIYMLACRKSWTSSVTSYSIL